MNEKLDSELAELYNYLCKSQDLAEECGELGLMNDIQKLRYRVDNIRFRV